MYSLYCGPNLDQFESMSGSFNGQVVFRKKISAQMNKKKLWSGHKKNVVGILLFELYMGSQGHQKYHGTRCLIMIG